MDGTEKARTLIAEDVEIVGTVKCAGSIEIAGRLNGDLNCNGTALINQSAAIKGNITADSTTVQGQINGNIAAKDRIEMKASARITGDIRAKRLTVEDGATFVGTSEVNPSGAGRPAGASDGKDAATDAEVEGAEESGGDAKGKGPGIFTRK